MRFFRFWLASLLAVVISACGGGGGSAGSNSGGTGSSISMSITDASGNVLSTNAINSSSVFFVRATVRSSANGSVANQLVNFTTDAAIATLSSPSALTDASGIARVQISPVAAGAASVTASTASGGTGMLAFQTSAANVTLKDLAVAQPTLSNRQSTDVSVQALVNNIPAMASEVSVTFSASCGTFSPATAGTAAGGFARSTYTPSASCSGAVNLTAAAPGAVPVNRSVTVSPSTPASLRFVSASESLLVVSTSSSGATTSTVTFQVLDDGAVGIRSQSVVLNLDARSLQLGVRFSVNGTATSEPQTVTSDGTGRVQVIVRSGSLPTPVVVTAALAADSSVRASSSGIAVTTGRAVQDRVSLSVSSLAIEAAVGNSTTDGVQTTLTMRIADRLGNPVPNGTAVNFVSSAGLVDTTNGTPGTGGVSAVCFTSGSNCSATFSTLGARPTNGLVTVLAYLDGEEAFVDADGNNVWDQGEVFADRGRLYLDLNANGVYDQTDQLIGDTPPGNRPCAATESTVANTCDGTWSGNTRVSAVARIAWASSDAVVTEVARNLTITRPAAPTATPPVAAQFNGSVTVRVADNRGNSMPVGSGIGASGCAGATVSPTRVPNTLSPTNVVVTFPSATDACNLVVTVSAPSGLTTSRTISLP